MILRPGLIFLQVPAVSSWLQCNAIQAEGPAVIVRLFRRFCSCFFLAAARIAAEGPSLFRTLLHPPPQWFPFFMGSDFSGFPR